MLFSAGGQPGPGRKSRRRGAPAFDGPPDETVQRLFPLSSNNGANNTASGFTALQFNTTGIDETANGAHALQNNSNGPYNTSDGFQALAANTTGGLNTGAGVNALFKNISGAQNTAVGVNAMLNNTSGSNNVALGYLAGSNLNTGCNNIDIGNPGGAAELNKIRIGTQGTQTATFIAGISGAGVTGGAPVEVTSAGQLGIVMSSARYKRDIADMGDKTSGLLRLRPVTFRYNNDQSGTLQYGLVAEEVAKVYPELVVYRADGKVMTVRYSMLSAMLLNELQKQNSELRNQTATNQRQAAQIQKLAERSDLQAEQNQRLATQVAQLKSMFEQATAAGKGGWRLAAAFNR